MLGLALAIGMLGTAPVVGGVPAVREIVRLRARVRPSVVENAWTSEDENRLLAVLIERYGFEIVGVEMVRLQATGRYSLRSLRLAVESRFPVF